MDISQYQDNRTLSSIWQLLIASAAGVLLGVISSYLPPLWVILLVVAFAILLVVIRRPEIAVLGVLIFLTTLLPDRYIPVVNVGPGRLYITEPIIIGLFIYIFVRWLVKHQPLVSTPLDIPILCFYGWALITTIVGVFVNKNVSIGLAIPEFRLLSYYLVFFVITNLLTKNEQVKLLLDGLFLLGTIVAIAMIVQFVMGTSFEFISGRVESLYTAGRRYADVTRITDTVGEGLITIAFIVKSVFILTSEWKWKRILHVIQWLLLGIAVGMTYNRTHWAVSFLAILLTLILGSGKDRYRVFKWVIIGSLTIPIILFLVIGNPNSEAAKFINSTIDRFTTILQPESYTSEYTSTLQWREFEYKYGLPQVANHPILGLGLGARYRPYVYGIDYEAFDGRAYTHSAHLWIAMKTGLVGYLFFIIFSIAFLWRGFKYWRSIVNPDMRSIYLGFTLAYLGVLIGSITHPIAMTLYWTPIIGLMLGINEVILRLNKKVNL